MVCEPQQAKSWMIWRTHVACTMALAMLVALFRAQKSLDFQGPPLPMALVIDIARLKIIMYRTI
jgi:hypothetical protein